MLTQFIGHIGDQSLHRYENDFYEIMIYVYESVSVICFVDRFIYAIFWISHISDIMWYLSFSF